MSDTVIKPMSEPARRLEIFTASGRWRAWRAWRAEQKAAIVAESLSGRDSVSSVARADGAAVVRMAPASAWRFCGT